MLPEATVHVQEAELSFANHPPIYQQPAYTPADWQSVTKWAVHNGEHDLFGDGAIVLVPTPGHTPGHQSVIVRLPGATVICVADAAYHPQKMAERKLPGYLWNPDAIISSWDRLEHIQTETEGSFVFSHYPVAGTGGAASNAPPRE
ncbi:MAG TPA: MBL fold metallo-hydrolase [Solirubrobacteraceae bacterium]|nr:MBL fold metallo-hydrolase [Solirubrobacteraceae bacterium]